MYLTRPFYQKCNSDADIGGYTESTLDDDIYWSFFVNDESLRKVDRDGDQAIVYCLCTREFNSASRLSVAEASFRFCVNQREAEEDTDFLV